MVIATPASKRFVSNLVAVQCGIPNWHLVSLQHAIHCMFLQQNIKLVETNTKNMRHKYEFCWLLTNVRVALSGFEEGICGGGQLFIELVS